MPPAPAPAPVVTQPVAPVDPNANRKDVSGNLLSEDEKNAPTAPTPLLVTSNASRATYNENVTNLNATKSNLAAGAATGKQNYNFVDSTGKLQTVAASSPEEAMANAKNIDPHSGVVTPTLTKTDGAPADGSDPADPTKTGGSTDTGGDTSGTTDASGNVENGDGTVTMPDGTRADKSLVASYTAANTRLQEGIDAAKATLNSALATMQDDPAAKNAIDMIMSKFDEQIKLTVNKNKVLMGAARVNAARSGGLQYASEMTDNFLSEEQDAATQRVTDFVTKESQAVLAAANAYKKGDIAAFNAASTALTKAQDAKTKALSDLLTQTDKIVKERQAQQRIDQTKTKAQLTTDVTTSTKIAVGMADAIQKSGLTDPAKIDAYVKEMATQNGITNPAILQSALVTAQAAASKASLAAENTRSTIAKRESTGGKKAPVAKGGTDGAYSYSGDDLSTYTKFLNTGGTLPDGTTAAPRGDDTYVDPKAYVYAYNDWVKQGGTPQGFVKKFPVTNVNPASYPQLPAGLQPKTKTTTTPQFQVTK